MIVGAGLYTICRGQHVSVVIRFNPTFLPLRPYYEKIYISCLNGAESLTTYGRKLWCSL